MTIKKTNRLTGTYRSCGAIAVAAICGLHGAQAAEETKTESDDTLFMLEEIVVTARRRSESLQDVPIAITAITQDTIDKQGIDGVADFAMLVPNVTFANSLNLGTNFLTIRGQTQSQAAPPPVAVVVDGILAISPLQFNVNEFDLQQIEVLKGPQGAIYGRNAIAGVFNITSRKPSNEFEGRARVGYGRGNEYKAQATVGGPVIENKLFVSVGASYKDRRGQIKNVTTGEFTDHFKDFTGRLRVIAKPIDSVEFDLKYTYSDTKGSEPAFITSSTGDPLQLDDPINVNRIGSNPRKIHDLSGKLDWDTDAGTVTAILAYVNVSEDLFADFDFSSPDYFRAEQLRKHTGFSQELRFASTQDGPIRWLIGAYHVKSEARLTSDLFVEPFLFGITAAPIGAEFLFQHTDDINRYETYAGFGQLEYDITNNLELALALRYDDDSNTQTDNANNVIKAEFAKWQPKATLTYKAENGFMYYGSAGVGFRSGDFNSSDASFGNAIVKAESATTYEIGFKGRLLNDRILLNAATFYTNLKNGQFKIFDATGATNVGINIDKTEIKGFEVETAFLITDELRLNASIGYTDSTIKNFTPPVGYPAGAVDYTGNTPTRVPDYSFNIGLSYETLITEGINIFATSNYSRVGSWYWDPENDYQRAPSNIVNVRIGLRSDEKSWTVTAWVKNALNEKNTSDYRPFTNTGHPLGIDAYYPAVGATYGIQATFNF